MRSEGAQSVSEADETRGRGESEITMSGKKGERSTRMVAFLMYKSDRSVWVGNYNKRGKKEREVTVYYYKFDRSVWSLC